MVGLLLTPGKSRMKANTYHNNYEIPLYLHLQPYFGEWEPREIKTSMVQQFVDIKGERYAKETIKKMTERENFWGICCIFACDTII